MAMCNGDGNTMLDQIEYLIENTDDKNIKMLAMAIYDTRRSLYLEIKHIKDTVNSIKTFIQVGLTIISILLSIVVILSYMK